MELERNSFWFGGVNGCNNMNQMQYGAKKREEPTRGIFLSPTKLTNIIYPLLPPF